MRSILAETTTVTTITTVERIEPEVSSVIVTTHDSRDVHVLSVERPDDGWEALRQQIASEMTRGRRDDLTLAIGSLVLPARQIVSVRIMALEQGV